MVSVAPFVRGNVAAARHRRRSRAAVQLVDKLQRQREPETQRARKAQSQRREGVCVSERERKKERHLLRRVPPVAVAAVQNSVATHQSELWAVPIGVIPPRCHVTGVCVLRHSCTVNSLCRRRDSDKDSDSDSNTATEIGTGTDRE